MQNEVPLFHVKQWRMNSINDCSCRSRCAKWQNSVKISSTVRANAAAVLQIATQKRQTMWMFSSRFLFADVFHQQST
jgi:hypothetical protein